MIYELVLLHTSDIPKCLIKRNTIGPDPIPHNFRVSYIWTLRMASAAQQNYITRLILSPKRVRDDMTSL